MLVSDWMIVMAEQSVQAGTVDESSLEYGADVPKDEIPKDTVESPYHKMDRLTVRGGMEVAATETQTETKWSPRGIQRQISSRISPSATSEDTSKGAIVCCVCFCCCLFYAGLIIGIYSGATRISSGNEYADNSADLVHLK